MSGSVGIERDREGTCLHLLIWKDGRQHRFCGHAGRHDRRWVRYLMLDEAYATCETCNARLAVLKKFWQERGIDETHVNEVP